MSSDTNITHVHQKPNNSHDETSSHEHNHDLATANNNEQNQNQKQKQQEIKFNSSPTFQPLQSRTYSLDGMVLRKNLVSHSSQTNNSSFGSPSLYSYHHHYHQVGKTIRPLHKRTASSDFISSQSYPITNTDSNDTQYVKRPSIWKQHSSPMMEPTPITTPEMSPLISRYGSKNNVYNTISTNTATVTETNEPDSHNVLLSLTKKESSVTNIESKKSGFIPCFVYALINTSMSVPCLYGYASVIFNHDAFQPYTSSLSKLVIWSSAVHQMAFVLFSSLSFAKAEVQDAGLIFLSTMTSFIASTILDSGGTIEQVLSTSIVALGVATTTLGIVLVFFGKFQYANIVSYLPLPVVGGYLAFIGYFCLLAGIGLCISKNMVDIGFLADFKLLYDRQSFILALPGIVSGLILTIIARFSTHEAALPVTMVAIPTIFYIIMYFGGISFDEARENLWIGEVEPSSSIKTILELVDFNQIQWDLIFSSKCIYIWLGMVFVVSFSSCLDVAAISMDMGEVLDVNKELATVGLSNVLSGIFLGQTGSYIFSQTLFTYRTGYHSRWIGVMGTLGFLFVVLSKVNLLEIVPLFFLGSTLIFIGIDLVYEWIWEIRHKLLLTEYLVLLCTFTAILFVGIDAGIIFGIIVAVVEYVVTTSTAMSLRRVQRRSRYIYHSSHRRLLEDVGYDSNNPKIVTLEIKESIFFGTSLQLLTSICDEIGISATPSDIMEISLNSPIVRKSTSHHQNKNTTFRSSANNSPKQKVLKPRYVILDLSQVPNVDASAARGCFLQLSKMCSKNNINILVSGANIRVDWVLRSHDVAYSKDEEPLVKRSIVFPADDYESQGLDTGKILLFETLNEALELCEKGLLYEIEEGSSTGNESSVSPSRECLFLAPQDQTIRKLDLSEIFETILGVEHSQNFDLLKSLDKGGLFAINEIELSVGDIVFTAKSSSDAFYVCLAGSVELFRIDPSRSEPKKVISAKGVIRRTDSRSHLGDIGEAQVAYKLQAGSVFGYVDFALGRARSFNAASSQNGTIVAEISHDALSSLQNKDKELHGMIEKVLFQVCVSELAHADFA